MKKTILSIGIICISIIGIIQSCKKDSEGCGATNISSTGKNESHNMGQNCINCHSSGGSGKGCFSVAGTTYSSNLSSTIANGTIKLYTGAGGTGTLKATVAVDAKGNFYTTDGVDFSGGLYPVFTSSAGVSNYISTSTSTGQCSSCHGVSTNRIYSN